MLCLQDHKSPGMGPSLVQLTRYRNEGEWCCSRLTQSRVIRNQKSIHDMEAQSFPTAEKFIAKASALKFMAIVFWDDAGLLLVDILHHGDCNFCVSLQYTLKGYRWLLVAEGHSCSVSQSLFSSNACPNTANRTCDWLQS